MAPTVLKWPWRCYLTTCFAPATWSVMVGRSALLTVCDAHKGHVELFVGRTIEPLTEDFRAPDGWTSIRKPRQLGGTLIGAQAPEVESGET